MCRLLQVFFCVIVERFRLPENPVTGKKRERREEIGKAGKISIIEDGVDDWGFLLLFMPERNAVPCLRSLISLKSETRKGPGELNSACENANDFVRTAA